jgi:hypothetical protein
MGCHGPSTNASPAANLLTGPRKMDATRSSILTMCSMKAVPKRAYTCFGGRRLSKCSKEAGRSPRSRARLNSAWPLRAIERDGLPRLALLLDRLQPVGVLILGAATRDAAGRYIKEKGTPWQWVYHPSGKNNYMRGGRYACTPEQLRAAWRALTKP